MERTRVVRQALRSPRGQTVSRTVAIKAMANAWEIGAWQAATKQPRKAILWVSCAAALLALECSTLQRDDQVLPATCVTGPTPPLPLRCHAVLDFLDLRL